MDTDLGSRIKYFRDLRGFSQEELAHYCGVSTPAVSNLGDREITTNGSKHREIGICS